MAAGAPKYSKAFWMSFLPVLLVVLTLAHKAFPDCRCGPGEQWPWYKCCPRLTIDPPKITRCTPSASAVFHSGPGAYGAITWDVTPSHPAIKWTPREYRCDIELVNPEVPGIPSSLTITATVSGCEDVNTDLTKCDNPSNCTWTVELGVDVSGAGNCGGDGQDTGGRTCGQTGSPCGNPQDPGTGQVVIRKQRAFVNLSLGGSSKGGTAGTLVMDLGPEAPDMVTGANMQLAATDEVWPTEDSGVRIVKTPVGCAKIIDTDPTDRRFTVEFYDSQDPAPTAEPAPERFRGALRR